MEGDRAFLDEDEFQPLDDQAWLEAARHPEEVAQHEDLRRGLLWKSLSSLRAAVDDLRPRGPAERAPVEEPVLPWCCAVLKQFRRRLLHTSLPFANMLCRSWDVTSPPGSDRKVKHRQAKWLHTRVASNDQVS